MYEHTKHTNVAEKIYEFPMLGFESEQELLDSDFWKSVTKFLIEYRHPRCECCGGRAEFALPTKVDSDVYLGRFPGFIATLCETHYETFLTDRKKLEKALMRSVKDHRPNSFWPKRHKRSNFLKWELIEHVIDVRKSTSS